MKIAYFDYWTGGIGNYIPIDIKLRELGHETVLLHVGSFNDPQLSEETIDNILCKDITYYKTSLIYKMLKREKPDIVITTDTTKILDRVVTLSCRHLNIKSIFLMHGNKNFGDSQEQVVKLFEKSYNPLMKKFKKIPKYASIVLPNYLYALYKYDPTNLLNLRFLRVVYSYFKNFGKSIFYPEYTDEIVQDKCLVYSNNERDYYKQLGYNQNNIHVIGNPKFDSLLDMLINRKITTDMLPDSVKELVCSRRKYALFLEEAIPEQSEIGGYTAEARKQIILDIAERLEGEKLKLVVKLHPCTDIETIKIKHDNMIIERNHLDSLIFYSEFCITNMSTTINNCVLMGKPVLAPRWNAAKNLPTFFSDIGISNFWNRVNEPLDLQIKVERRNKYIENCITVTKPDAVNNIIRHIL